MKEVENPEKLEEPQGKVQKEVRERVEEELLPLPILQYAWLEVQDLVFAQEVREICRTECPRYAKSWSCPPGIGTVEECQKRCLSYDGVFVFSTIAEVQDAENMEETLKTRAQHEAVTRSVRAALQKYFQRTLPLSGESCAFCEKCTCPDAPCRCPQQRISCVEGYGIVVPAVAEKAGIAFENGPQTVTWFGMVLYAK